MKVGELPAHNPTLQALAPAGTVVLLTLESGDAAYKMMGSERGGSLLPPFREAQYAPGEPSRFTSEQHFSNLSRHRSMRPQALLPICLVRRSDLAHERSRILTDLLHHFPTRRILRESKET